MKESRRRLLQHMLTITNSMLAKPQVFFEAIHPELLPALMAKWTDIDGTSLDQLEAVTRQYWTLFFHAASKHELLPGLSGHLQTILQFLHSSQSRASHNRLYALASETALIVGTLLFDLQDHHYASTYYRFAIAAAREAGDHALQAIGLGRLSFLPIYADEPQQALPLLHEANALLPSASYPLIRSWLALIEAEAVAHLGNVSACEQALASAETMQERSGSEEEVLWTQINHASLPGYKGACYLQLHIPDRALDALQDTLHHLSEHAHRHRSIIFTDLALTMVQLEEIEEACRFFQQALDLTRQTKSLMVLLRMQQARTKLEKWTQTPSVRALDELIRESVPHFLLASSW